MLRRMYETLKHRGPDDRGFYTDKNVSLGHARLSIIDLSARGRQPMSNAEGSIQLTYNGEIYNFQDIRTELEDRGYSFVSDTDTEVIVHGYSEYGIDIINRLRGMFAFALYDTQKQKLFLVRDRAGIKPVYYYFDGEKLIFASEIKAILEHGIERKTNNEAMQQFLAFRYTPSEQTLFDGIRKISAGCYMEFDLRKKEMKMNRYWDLKFRKTKHSEKYYIDKTRELIEESVRMRLISDVPFGAYLSGGIDSSIITGLMSQMTDEPVKTFTVGFGYESDETGYARMVSDHFGTNHREFIVEEDTMKLLPAVVKHFDEPVADPAAIPTYLMSEKTKKFATVALLGEGADEVFGGYEQYRIIPLAQKMNFMPSTLRGSLFHISGKLPNRMIDKFFKYRKEFGEKGNERLKQFLKAKTAEERYLTMVTMFTPRELNELVSTESDAYAPVRQYFNTRNTVFNRLLLADFKTFMTHLLMKVDKMTMAYAVEARVPYLDHVAVEFAAGMPQRMKVRGTTEKYVLRKAFHDILPKQINQRKKQRFFVPINKWLMEDARDFAWDYIERGIREKHFDSRYVDKIKKGYSRSEMYYARQLWNMLNFEIWHDVFDMDS